MRALKVVGSRCSPRVFFAVFRTYWSGWLTSKRCKKMFIQSGLYTKHCVLQCGMGEDTLCHYILCDRYWQFLRAPRPRGMGIPDYVTRSRESALLLADNISNEDLARLAVALFSQYRTVNAVRFGNITTDLEWTSLLRLWAKNGARGSLDEQG